MGNLMKGLFGGRGRGEQDALAAARESRAIQAVSNDRQLAALNAGDDKGGSRRNPRGRRLFVSDPNTKSNLS